MTSIQQIRDQLAGTRSFGPGLVAVFVGGTSGIGESTARELVRYSISPRVYLIGRSQEQAARIKNEFAQLNSSSDVRFIQSDISRLRNVDEVCEQVKTQEEVINLLFLTPDTFHFRGREETIEGLDRKMALDFYSRLRFTENFLPLLRHASTPHSTESNSIHPPPLARVFSVLGGGRETSIDTSDLSLKHNYSLDASTKHAITMTTAAFDRLATSPENTGVLFYHTHPGMVKTNGDRELGSLFKLLLGVFIWMFKPWTVPIQDCGERHLWAATSDSFKGGKVHLIGQRSERLENARVLTKLNEEGLSEKVWRHTRDVFEDICNSEDGKY